MHSNRYITTGGSKFTTPRQTRSQAVIGSRVGDMDLLQPLLWGLGWATDILHVKPSHRPARTNFKPLVCGTLNCCDIVLGERC